MQHNPTSNNSIRHKGKRSWFALFLAAYGFCGNVHAVTILLGSDYLETERGGFHFEQVDIPGKGLRDIDLINVFGNPLPGEPGNTDTIIERLQDATLTTRLETAIVDARLKKMALNAFAKIDGMDFEVRLRFEGQGEGKLGIELETPVPHSGFLSGNVFHVPNEPLPATLDLSLTPVSGGPTLTSRLQVDLDISETGGFPGADAGATLSDWVTNPELGTVLVTGQRGNQSANRHEPRGVDDFDLFPAPFAPWQFIVRRNNEAVGFVELRAATTSVPDGGPGVTGFLLLVSILVGSHLRGEGRGNRRASKGRGG